MNQTELIEHKLKPALAECALHRQRLHQAWVEAAAFACMQHNTTPEKSMPDEAEVRVLDQLVFRFGKLQDALGNRVLPTVLKITGDWRDDETFVDKLDRAEKLRLLPGAEEWQVLRELRNQSAHEYPEQPQVWMQNLQRLHRAVPALERGLDSVMAFVRGRVGA